MSYLNAITHIEIPAPDFTAAVEFYSNVFGWEIETLTVDHYAYFKIGKTGSGGALDASLLPAPERTGPQLTIDVENIDVMLRTISEFGGNIIQDKQEIPGGHGFFAIITDPNGNYLQLHSMA